MFGNWKTKNDQQSVFKNSLPMRHAYSRAPGTSSSVTEGNEADRLVRCRVCGWICDRERDVRMKDGVFAHLGIKYSEQQTADSSIGDAPSGRSTSEWGEFGWGDSGWGEEESNRKPDKYYTREVVGGCPCCGTFLYDEEPAPIPPLE